MIIAAKPANESSRVAALRRYEILDTAPDQAFDDLVFLASEICQAPAAMVTLIDENRQWFKARLGLDLSETSRDLAFCAHSILQGDQVFEVPDASEDPRFADHPAVVDGPRFRFYAGAPLVDPDGHALGTVCVMDHVPRTLPPEKREALRALSRRAVAQLELRHQARALAASEKEAGRMLALAEKSRRALLSVLEDERRVVRSLRDSEERFRLLAENIAEAFWIMDPLRRAMIYVSPAYATIWGRSCESLYANPTTWIESIHPDDRSRVAAATARRIQGSYQEIYRITRPDGAVRWIRDRGFPVRDDTDQVLRVVGHAEDITETRRLEEQYLQAQKMEAIGTLAGGIAHDFNNILGVINGYTELAQMSTTDAVVLEHLGYVRQAGTRAADLVRQILAFSRKEEQARRPVQMKHIVAEALKLLRATIPSSIEFKLDLDRDPPVVLADPTQLHQIVMNLCTNAWHAMREQPGVLEVCLKAVELQHPLAVLNTELPAGRYACLTIADTGVGMDETTLSRMFEPFYTTKGPGEGTGLGLAVVHGIVRSHEAGITATSRPGAGTTFRLYFPSHSLEAITPAIAAGVVPSGHGERILVVDDEALLVQVTRKSLEELGYKVEVSTNPLSALEEFRRRPADFDLVVTDLTMPRMSGIELAGALLAIRPDIPIILTTGYTATVNAERARAAGIREFVLKPLSFDILGATVHRVLSAAAP
ncbi:hybrid sensor histidine kinase/response regulator [Horticoccus sp. 23ND18S-11]|uniref:hybrid sensor histidine kinase/response regulator n=1 Tax=Horticoccus sp. 23ND18S-11 TaxID=3391832 RepID=UPI0039C9E52D